MSIASTLKEIERERERERERVQHLQNNVQLLLRSYI